MPNYPTYKLGEICKTTSGGTPDRKNSSYYNGSIPWVKSGELDKGIIYDTEERITEEAVKNSSAKIFPKGTLLIALYGATIGKLGFLGISAATNQAVCGIFPSEKVNLDFLSYFLFHKRKDLIAQGTGGAQPNISQTILKNLSIPLPPLAIQRLIVTRIETLFAELDKGVEKLKTAQQQLKTYRQAVLNDLLNNGNDEWKIVKLADICITVSDGDHLPPKRTTCGVPFITISDIKNNAIDFSNVSYMTEEYYNSLSDSRKAQKGDLLYTVTGSFGIPVLIDSDTKFCFQRHIGLIRPNPNCVSQKWLYYMMQSPIIYSQATEKATGTAQKTVTLTVLRNFNFPLPPLPTQQRIVKEIETRLEAAEAVEKNIAEALQQAEALRQSILKKAFDGELV